VVIGRKSGLRRVCINLQRVGEELVHLGDAGGDAEVDGSVTDLNDESANDVGVDLGKGVSRKKLRPMHPDS
jgi:hypothetical protein